MLLETKIRHFLANNHVKISKEKITGLTAIALNHKLLNKEEENVQFTTHTVIRSKYMNGEEYVELDVKEIEANYVLQIIAKLKPNNQFKFWYRYQVPSLGFEYYTMDPDLFLKL